MSMHLAVVCGFPRNYFCNSDILPFVTRFQPFSAPPNRYSAGELHKLARELESRATLEISRTLYSHTTFVACPERPFRDSLKIQGLY